MANPTDNPRATVTASFGEVLVTPLPFHSFRVGPFFCSLPVPDGEDPAVTLARAQDVVERHARIVYRQALEFWRKEWKVTEGPR